MAVLALGALVAAAPAWGQEQAVEPTEPLIEPAPGEGLGEPMPGQAIGEEVPGQAIGEEVPGQAIGEDVPGQAVPPYAEGAQPVSAAEPGAQDIQLVMVGPGLAEATFTRQSPAGAAAGLRQAAEAFGVPDGQITREEAEAASSRLAGGIEGSPSTTTFLDGFPATQVRVRMQAEGLEGAANATGPVTVKATLLLVFPVMDQQRHELLLVPGQSGNLAFTPPRGWNAQVLDGTGQPAGEAPTQLSLTEGQPVRIQLVRGEDQLGQGVPAEDAQGLGVQPEQPLNAALGGAAAVPGLAALALAGLLGAVAVAARRRR